MTTSPIHREALSELEPCPFCGGEAISTHEQECEGAETYYWHVCSNCGANSEGDHGRQRAALQWNRRAPSSAARERDALRAALERIAGDEKPELGNRNTNDLLARMYWEYATSALSPRSETSPDKKEG